jgi:hypothetical protein
MKKDSDKKEDGDKDFYWEKGLMVFTRSYHLKRGYCCANGCRHCPYKNNADGQIRNP